MALLVVHAALPARASDEFSELDLFTLDSEVRESVTTTAKIKQDIREAPSVVTVVTREELQGRGYDSVAEVLKAVAGFHVLDDLALLDAGVRGTHTGPGGGSRLIKVMIDGISVDFRSTSGNVLGPELIPMDAVERIEIIRGPVSALYGADAFLGVVNVLTRKTGDLDGYRVGLRGGLIQTANRPSSAFGSTLSAGTRADRVGLLVAGAFDTVDRSGLALPQSSPHLNLYADRTSRADRALPKSVFAKLDLDGQAKGTFRFLGLLQVTDVGQEFIDNAIENGDDLALSHRSRLNLFNGRLAVDWKKAIDKFEFVAQASFGAGEIGPSDRLQLTPGPTGRTIEVVRQGGYLAPGTSFEFHWLPLRAFSLVAGADFALQLERPLRLYNRYLAAVDPFGAGDLRQIQDTSAQRVFANGGLYAQLIYYPLTALGLTGGFRLDLHSFYGPVPSGRFGLVYLIGDNGYAKALVGHSFKAPTDDQLFGTARQKGLLYGNPQLAPQRATTGELVLGYDLAGRYGASLTGFYTLTAGKVEFVPTGSSLKATNLGQLHSFGGELEAKYQDRQAFGWLDYGVWANVSLVYSRRQTNTAVLSASSPEPFPSVLSNLGAEASLPRIFGHVFGELNVVGATSASGSNNLLATRDGRAAYYLPPHALVSVGVSSLGLRILGRPLELRFKVSNLLNSRFAHPGNGGIDIPGQGRTFFLQIKQEF